MRVQWEGSECGETISFSLLIHLFPLQKGSAYHSPKGWCRFVDVLLATHQHFNDQLCLQPLLQPSLAKLKTFCIYLSRDMVKKKATASRQVTQASSTTGPQEPAPWG